MNFQYCSLFSAALFASSCVFNFHSPLLASILSSAPKKLEVKGVGVTKSEVGVWKVIVDTEKQTIETTQVSGDFHAGIKVASLLGPGPVNAPQSGGSVYQNNSLLSTNGKNYASVSSRFQIINNSGSSLGLPANTSAITGIKLLLVPDSNCPGTTLGRPICVLSNSSRLVPGTGASGSRGADPVFLSYMNPRDGSNLSVNDDSAPIELNEPTGVQIANLGGQAISTLGSHAVWQPSLTIPNGGSGFFGLRFRYAQDTAGSGQPRVTRFTYQFRILAERRNSPQLTTVESSYVTTLISGFVNRTDLGCSGVGFNTGFPGASEFISTSDAIYFYNRRDGGICKIDLATSQLSTVLATGHPSLPPMGSLLPITFALSADERFLFFAFDDGQSVKFRKINLANRSVSDVFTTPNSLLLEVAPENRLYNFVVSPDGNSIYLQPFAELRIYKADILSNSVSLLLSYNPGSNSLVPFLSTLFPLTELALTPDGNTLLIPERNFITNSRTIAQLDLKTNAITRNPLPDVIRGGNVRFSKDGNTIYVINDRNLATDPLTLIRYYLVDRSTSVLTYQVTASTEQPQDGRGNVATFYNDSCFFHPFSLNPSTNTLYLTEYSGTAFFNCAIINGATNQSSANARMRQIQVIDGQAPATF